MFYQGDLQSGISTAIQQQKLVTCFVSDDNDESTVWEAERLSHISELLQQKTVLLKIRLQSQEASFLSAFCQLDSAPSIVVIDNGRIVVKLGAETSPEDWVSQMEAALHVRDVAVPTQSAATATSYAASSTSTPTTPSTAPSVSATPVSSTASVDPSQRSVAETASSSGTPAPLQPPHARLNDLMPDDAAKLETDHAAKQAAEKAERVARAETRRQELEVARTEARRQELEAAQASSKGKGKQPAESTQLPPKARRDWMLEQSKRKAEAKSERERILQQIKSDREERRARTAIQKEASAYAPAEAMRSDPKTSATRSATCALQIRLVDGTSIKRQFEPGQSLKEVRAWIKETAAPDTITPSYTFKQFLAPLPNKNIENADEEQSLWSNGLTPSATLIMVPIDEPEPVATGGVLGVLMRLLAGLLAIFTSFFASIPAGRAPETEVQSTSDTAATASGVEAAPRARQRHKTFAASRAADADDTPTEFYNGNSSAFEGRKDNDDD